MPAAPPTRSSTSRLAAFLVNSAQVTDKVAQQLHLPPETVGNLVTATARSDVNAIDVTAISTNPKQAVALANAAAAELNQYVVAANEVQFNQQLKSIKTSSTR